MPDNNAKLGLLGGLVRQANNNTAAPIFAVAGSKPYGEGFGEAGNEQLLAPQFLAVSEMLRQNPNDPLLQDALSSSIKGLFKYNPELATEVQMLDKDLSRRGGADFMKTLQSIASRKAQRGGMSDALMKFYNLAPEVTMKQQESFQQTY